MSNELLIVLGTLGVILGTFILSLPFFGILYIKSKFLWGLNLIKRKKKFQIYNLLNKK